MALLKRHGLSDEQAAAFLRLVVKDLPPDPAGLQHQLDMLASRLEEWLDRDARRDRVDLLRLFGAAAGGIGLGVAGNYVSDLIKGDPWGRAHVGPPLRDTVTINIAPNASRQGLWEGLTELVFRQESRSVREILALIYLYATRHRSEFDAFEDKPWSGPGSHLGTSVDEGVGRALTEWARDRAQPRGVLCAGMVQAVIERRLPYWTVEDEQRS